jgi:hypothetical protein
VNRQRWDEIKETINFGERNIKEYSILRYGLGAATFFITIIVIALFFKIRDIENK